MFYLYKIHINLPKQSKKKISALSVKTLRKTSLETSFFRRLETPQCPENPNRTPSSSHPIPNAAQAPVPIEASYWWPDQLIPGGLSLKYPKSVTGKCLHMFGFEIVQ